MRYYLQIILEEVAHSQPRKTSKALRAVPQHNQNHERSAIGFLEPLQPLHKSRAPNRMHSFVCKHLQLLGRSKPYLGIIPMASICHLPFSQVHCNSQSSGSSCAFIQVIVGNIPVMCMSTGRASAVNVLKLKRISRPLGPSSAFWNRMQERTKQVV